uniref:Putative kDa family member n=1 Tax=Rhipicephalus microplus TaxID=6941 RepID=A0A6G5A530_RHIMP
MKCCVFAIVALAMILMLQNANGCDKKTLLIGKTGCLLGAVPILPGQTLELRCPCANVSCHDGLKRIIVSWCDNPQTPLIDSKAE